MGIFDFAKVIMRLASDGTLAKEPSLRLRWAEARDVGDVWDLLSAAGAGIFVGKSSRVLAECLRTSRELERRGGDLPLFGAAVAHWGDDPIGAACCVRSSNAVQLLWIGVTPSRRRLGVGRELLRFVCGAATPGVEPLVTLVPEDLTGAAKFFAACGWRVDRRRPLVPARFETADQGIVFVERNGCDRIVSVRIA